MRVLWIVNTIFPYPAKILNLKENISGWWLCSLSELIKKEVELGIISVYNGKELLELENNGIKYFLVPGKLSFKYDFNLLQYYNQINEKFQPDIVHLNGTEYTLGLVYFDSIKKGKVITSIQGVMHSIALHYLDGISNKDIIRNITIRDIIKRDNLYQQQRKYQLASLNEKEIIEKSTAIIGRTNYDFSYFQYNPFYYHCDELMRPVFFNYQWNISNVEKHSIFCSQGSYPIKGIHILLQALSLLKNQYSDIKLYIGGTNIVDKSIKGKLKRTGYAKYVQQLITKNKLNDNIIYTGYLSEEKLTNRLLKSNVFVLPSSTENSSNSLCEAMLLGMPCVASYVGGNSDMLGDKGGLFYSFKDYPVLANCIDKLFKDDSLAIELGKRARKIAIKRHDPEKINKNLMKIYKCIMEEK